MLPPPSPAPVPLAQRPWKMPAGRQFLSSVKGSVTIPLITLPKELEERGSPRARRVFAAGASAHDLYTLAFPPLADTKCGEDYRTGPAIV